MPSPAGPRVRLIAGLVCLSALVTAALTSTARSGVTPPAVLIFAAASLQTVLDELTPEMVRVTGVDVRTSYAATSVLARQIESGAPADLFISADREWMDYLAARRGIRADSRVDLVGNQLVLVAPAARRVALPIAPGFPLAAAVGGERLAMADPDTVPAGRYARAALLHLGVWASIANRVAPADNVRAALVLVARGETPLGIVYRTDAMAEPRVAIVDVFPEATHPRIVYPAALTAHSSVESARVLAYLQAPAAAAVFGRHGFLALR